MGLIDMIFTFRARTLLACGVAFTTGWVNVVCTLRFGLFGTMMTGNSMMLAKASTAQNWGTVVFYTIAITTYYVGGWLYRAIDLKLDHRMSATALAPAVGLLLLVADILHAVNPMPDGGPNRWNVLPVTVAMGAVNTLVAKVDGLTTNAATGNLQKVSMAFFDHYFAGGLSDEQQREALITMCVVCSFLIGIATCTLWRDLVPLVVPVWLQGYVFIPIAVAFFLLLWAHDVTHAEELEKKRKQRLADKAKQTGGGASRPVLRTSNASNVDKGKKA